MVPAKRLGTAGMVMVNNPGTVGMGMAAEKIVARRGGTEAKIVAMQVGIVVRVVKKVGIVVKDGVKKVGIVARVTLDGAKRLGTLDGSKTTMKNLGSEQTTTKKVVEVAAVKTMMGILQDPLLTIKPTLTSSTMLQRLDHRRKFKRVIKMMLTKSLIVSSKK